MYIKAPEGAVPGVVPGAVVQGKRMRTAGGYSGSYSGGGAGSQGGSSAGGGPVGYAPVSNARDNPPCNTLFIGNLGDAVQEADLHVLFGGQPVRQSACIDKHAGSDKLSLLAWDAAAAASVGLPGTQQPAGSRTAAALPLLCAALIAFASCKAPGRLHPRSRLRFLIRCHVLCIMSTGLPAVEGVAQWPPSQLLRRV
jgi:hypothetical protein